MTGSQPPTGLKASVSGGHSGIYEVPHKRARQHPFREMRSSMSNLSIVDVAAQLAPVMARTAAGPPSIFSRQPHVDVAWEPRGLNTMQAQESPQGGRSRHDPGKE